MQHLKQSFVTCVPNSYTTDIMAPVLLNAFYDAGNKAGVFLAWATSLLLTAELAYVMFKYVFASSKED